MNPNTKKSIIRWIGSTLNFKATIPRPKKLIKTFARMTAPNTISQIGIICCEAQLFKFTRPTTTMKIGITTNKKIKNMNRAMKPVLEARNRQII